MNPEVFCRNFHGKRLHGKVRLIGGKVTIQQRSNKHILVNQEGVGTSKHVFVSVSLGRRHASVTVGHPQVTKMYNEEKQSYIQPA
jgi:hypothetical protein